MPADSLTPRQKAKALRQGSWDERRYHRTQLDQIMRRNPQAQEHALFNDACKCLRDARKYATGGVMREYQTGWARSYLTESIAMRTGAYPFAAARLEAAE